MKRIELKKLISECNANNEALNHKHIITETKLNSLFNKIFGRIEVGETEKQAYVKYLLIRHFVKLYPKKLRQSISRVGELERIFQYTDSDNTIYQFYSSDPTLDDRLGAKDRVADKYEAELKKVFQLVLDGVHAATGKNIPADKFLNVLEKKGQNLRTYVKKLIRDYTTIKDRITTYSSEVSKLDQKTIDALKRKYKDAFSDQQIRKAMDDMVRGN